jgi:hypothetical protein
MLSASTVHARCNSFRDLEPSGCGFRRVHDAGNVVMYLQDQLQRRQQRWTQDCLFAPSSTAYSQSALGVTLEHTLLADSPQQLALPDCVHRGLIASSIP